MPLRRTPHHPDLARGLVRGAGVRSTTAVFFPQLLANHGARIPLMDLIT
jgi:hypothetical protein